MMSKGDASKSLMHIAAAAIYIWCVSILCCHYFFLAPSIDYQSQTTLRKSLLLFLFCQFVSNFVCKSLSVRMYRVVSFTFSKNFLCVSICIKLFSLLFHTQYIHIDTAHYAHKQLKKKN